MKSVIISNPVWGEKYCDDFCNYSLKSLLFKGNIIKLKKKYKITLHILTMRDDLKFFQKNKYFNLIPEDVSIQFYFFKKNLFSKFSTITRLQNISISYSKDFDYILFNYADFIWGDLSLYNVIKELEESKKNFLTFFCLPVKGNSLKKFLKTNKDVSVTNLKKFSINNLHRYATLRFWDDNEFTLTPTFIIFPIRSLGLIVSAYHQTILAASTRKTNYLLRGGIKGITLDEYFSSVLNTNDYKVINNKENIMVSALCFGTLNSEIPSQKSRNDALKWCFKRFNNCNRELSENLIFFSSLKLPKNSLLIKAKTESLKKIKELNATYKFTKFSHFFLTNYLIVPCTEKVLSIYRLIHKYIFKLKHLMSLIIYNFIYIYGKSINWGIYYLFSVLFQRQKILRKPKLFKILKKKIYK